MNYFHKFKPKISKISSFIKLLQQSIVQKKYSKMIIKIIPSKKYFLSIIIFLAIIRKKISKSEDLNINEINFNEEIYKKIKDKKLFDNPERRLDIDLNFLNMNFSKDKFIKKLSDMNNEKEINFLHEYKYNLLKNSSNSYNVKSKIDSLKYECKKIEYFMRNIINSLEIEIYKFEKKDYFEDVKNKVDYNFLEKFNANKLINFIKEIEIAKKNSIFSLEDHIGIL
jgi:hypothetical protein